MDTTDTPVADPQDLRDVLVAEIDSLITFRTEAVKDAFRAVPWHLFLPEMDLATAYMPKQVVTRRAVDGTALSSASSPNIVATMLEQLAVSPGMQVLEIGAATGIDAALLAELDGPAGEVVIIELDDDLAEGARTHLTEAGYEQVTVLCRDGALGDADRAPLDRITSPPTRATSPPPGGSNSLSADDSSSPLDSTAAALPDPSPWTTPKRAAWSAPTPRCAGSCRCAAPPK